MRILILSQYFAPEPNFKPTDLAFGLAKRGHDVVVVTAFPNFPSGRLYEGYRLRLLQWETVNGVRILRLPLFPDHSRSGGRRTLNYLSFAAAASTLGLAFCGQADAMYVFHPPLTIGIPALLIGLLRGIPYVYEVQDIWPESVALSGMITNRIVLKLLGQLERFVYRFPSAISVHSPGLKRNIRGKGCSSEKIHVIPNWADESIYRPVPANLVLAESVGMQGRFNVMYAGTIGLMQALDVVVRAAQLLKQYTDIQFVFVGSGVDEPRLKELVAKVGVTNVKFLGRQDPQRMAEFYALADALLVHLRKNPLFEISIPSKTYAYLACGRPILMGVVGDAAEVVRNAGAGICFEPESAESLAEAVLQLYHMAPSEREAMGRAGRQTFLQNHTRALLVDHYEDLLSSIAHRE